jgi:hypothetical protein
MRRSKKTFSEAFLLRFSQCDQDLLDLLSKWEAQYAPEYPIFHAWIKLQRKRLPIKEATEFVRMHLEHIELKVFDIAERERVVSRESASVESELNSILTIFTPTLEEAFAHVNDDPLTDPHLHESPGTNDELFLVAREKYNYLLKKLIPRMSNLVVECESGIRDMCSYAAAHPAILGESTVERWNKCS